MIQDGQMKWHPVSDLFPMLGKAELAELAEDIRQNGLRDEIVTYEDCVLDGRNRYLACQIANVKPRFIKWDGSGGSPTLYVVSKNLHRRHLTAAQRAAIGAKFLPRLAEEAKKRQQDHRGTAPGKPARTLMVTLPEVISGPSRDLAAEAVQVSASSIQRARYVKQADLEAFSRLEKGESTVNAEYRKVRKTPEPPRRSRGTGKRQAIRGNAAKERMIVGLSTIRGLCTGLEMLKVDFIQVACTETEIHTWTEEARSLSRRLQKFARQIGGNENAER
jgi:hypothetical protein